MVFPESAADVSKIVKILDKHSCPFGMRSGAHSAFEGANGIKDGVTVDFGYINATTYNEATEVASIGPGSTWGKAYQTLAPYDVVPVGGRADVVGVGGFTTGGGYSFHTGVRGFAADNVVNFEVVTGKGDIVNANAQENSDLWHALKGGSGNFGFVTRIDTQVWPSSTIFASLNIVPFEEKAAVRQVYLDFVNAQDEDPASQIIVASSYADGAFTCGVILSNINAQQDSPSFDAANELPVLQTVPVTGPAHVVVPVFTGPTPLGLFANWQTGMVAHNMDIMEAIDEIMVEHVQRMQTLVAADAFEMIFQWQPVTAGMVRVMNERGGNIMGLEDVVADGDALMYNIVFTVNTKANQDLVLPVAFEMQAAIQAKANELGVNKNWDFLNYAHGSQDPLSHYGADNIALMQAVSKKYDPKSVFQTLRKTGFHLPGPLPPRGPPGPAGGPGPKI
jgi:FAD/FMN-containing dehydrogenase